MSSQNIPKELTEFIAQFGDVNGETTTFTNEDLITFFADRGEKVMKTKRDPLMPVKPKSGMALYFEQKSVDVANKLVSSGELTECSKVLTGLREGWRNLTKEQGDNYKDEAAKNREQWKCDMESWYDEHPEDRPRPKAKAKANANASSTKFDATQDPDAPEGWIKGAGFLKGIIRCDKSKAISFKSFEEAVAKAEELGAACGGITKTKTGFALRKGNEIKGIDFSKDEISWFKN
jgi:hypothetical protein